MRGASVAFVVALAPVACTPSLRTSPREPLVCPHDAVVAGGACRCAPGLAVLEGACVGPRELDAYCSPLPSRAGACAAATCAGSDPLDLATGRCAAARTARDVAAQARPIPDDLALGCHEGRTLVVRPDYVACIPAGDTCPRGTTWEPGTARCAPVPACPPGEVRAERDDGAPAGCVRVVTRVAEGAAVVDVGRWARAMLGTDGGMGTSRLCRPFAQALWGDDVGAGGARTLALTIQLLFPDNDVTQLSADVQALDAASGQPIPGDAGRTARAARSALSPLLVPLRSLGGVSDAASLSVGVRCTVRGGGSPLLFPR
jgi:hypothetical protein